MGPPLLHGQSRRFVFVADIVAALASILREEDVIEHRAKRGGAISRLLNRVVIGFVLSCGIGGAVNKPGCGASMAL